MTRVISIEGVEIIQKNFQQILIRGDGKEKFNQIMSEEISISPPSKNLEIAHNKKYIFAKNSFDQWSLIYLEEVDYNKILKFISNVNASDGILASDYSYGQIYFEITGKDKNIFLNKLTNFDLRLKKFPKYTMAQTLISRVDCHIYNLDEKFIVTCNKSYENYFKERFIDLAKLH